MWTFSTIFDPKYGQHPVSGNRDFGFTAHGDGTYTFYTRGVDRLTSIDGAILQQFTEYGTLGGVPFRASDGLWASFQAYMDYFINNNQGTAEVQNFQTLRPNWNQVKLVLNGYAPLSSLSKDCPD